MTPLHELGPPATRKLLAACGNALSPLWSQPISTPQPTGGIGSGSSHYLRKCFLGFTYILSKETIEEVRKSPLRKE